MKIATLRHVGIKVNNLTTAIAEYEQMGFKQAEDPEIVWVQKMQDKDGNIIELIQGKYAPHFAVNWFEDKSGNRIEVVEEKE